jgi:phosphoribosyl 1,2-cyclic phosphodiesterase
MRLPLPSAVRQTAAERRERVCDVAGNGDFSVKIWGARGSIPCPGKDYLKYGGNTPCIEIRCGKHVLVFDSGTGVRELGRALAAEGVSDVDLFLSHTHIDHVSGLPFFCFAFSGGNALRIWAGHLMPDYTVEGVLRSLMNAPLFPVPIDIFKARLSFRDFIAGDALDPKPGVRIRTALLNHPNRATGYRVEYGGRSICYVTDTEHVPGRPDRNVLDLIHGADIVIYDAMFDDAEHAQHIGWGHSSWEECLRLCKAAGVKTPVLFHHLPGRTDAELDRVAAAANVIFPGVLIACEGLVLTP